MVRIGSKLQKQGVIMALFTLGLINTGCEERFESSVVNSSEGKTVEVTLNIGFDDDVDATSLFPTTKSVSESKAFNVRLTPCPETKSAADSYPDKLYNLEVCQYDANGTLKQYKNLGNVTPGTNITLDLNDLADCQLFFLARGDGNTAGSISGKSFDGLNDVVASADVINGLTDIKKMPYFLHLKNVKIASGK